MSNKRCDFGNLGNREARNGLKLPYHYPSEGVRDRSWGFLARRKREEVRCAHDIGAHRAPLPRIGTRPRERGDRRTTTVHVTTSWPCLAIRGNQESRSGTKSRLLIHWADWPTLAAQWMQESNQWLTNFNYFRSLVPQSAPRLIHSASTAISFAGSFGPGGI